MSSLPCPCGSGKSYRACCGPLLRGETPALTAEALMRSRYTAYVRRDEVYLMRTCHPSTRPAALELDGAIWLGLEVLSATEGGEGDDVGVVTFAAAYEEADGSVATLRETSKFVREDGAWVYLAGEHDT